MKQTSHDSPIHPDFVRPTSGIGSYYLFEREASSYKVTGMLDKQAEALEHGKALRCANCKTVITYQGHAENRRGQHVHRFFNPGGYEFTIGCFRRAWCKVIGLPTLEWSWFDGYTWQYALCPQCQEHLGWFYHGSTDDSSFYGLILDRLASDSASHDDE